MPTLVIDNFANSGGPFLWQDGDDNIAPQTGLSTSNVSGGVREMVGGIGSVTVSGGAASIVTSPFNIQQNGSPEFNRRFRWSISPAVNLTDVQIQFGSIPSPLKLVVALLDHVENPPGIDAAGKRSWYRFTQSTGSTTVTIPRASFSGYANLSAVTWFYLYVLAQDTDGTFVINDISMTVV
jgi:hypothetical protein